MVVRHTSGTALELSLDRPNFLFRVLSNDTVYGVKGDVSDGKAFKLDALSLRPEVLEAAATLLVEREWKNLSGQQAEHETGSSIKLQNHSHLVWEPEWWDAPLPPEQIPRRRSRALPPGRPRVQQFVAPR